MKKTKCIIAGSLIFGGLLTVAAPAMAQWGRELRQDRREILENRRDLNEARREYRRDLRRGVPRGSARGRRGAAQPGDDAARVRATPIERTSARSERPTNVAAS